jgi:hypothetical protein
MTRTIATLAALSVTMMALAADIPAPAVQAVHSVQIVGQGESSPPHSVPEPGFLDDFEDEAGQWNQLQDGVVIWVDDNGNGILRKSGHDDPHGGWAALATAVEDFELVAHTRKADLLGGNRTRYSVTDATGNGYGIDVHFTNHWIGVERRDNWSGMQVSEDVAITEGLGVGVWYTLRLRRQGAQLTAEIYNGRVDPTTATPLATASGSDSTHGALSQVNINGGYTFDTDNIEVIQQ